MTRTSLRLPTLLRNSLFGLLGTALSLAFVQAPTQAAPPFTTLHTFNSYGDGIDPNGNGPLLAASDGNLYGTCYNSGTNNGGTVYRETTAGVVTTLHSFTNAGSPEDGYNPAGPVIQGTDGYLYGTCNNGGTSGNGTIWRIKTDGTSFKVVYTLGVYDSSVGGYPTGYTPNGGVTQAADGYLYGLTVNGGILSGGAGGNGTLYRVKTDGSSFSVLHAFTAASDGYNNYYAPVISGTTIYGAANNGGTSSYGTVWSISTAGSGFKVLHSFSSSSTDGFYPQPVVVSGSELYGETNQSNSGYGNLYKMKTDGTGFSVIRNFQYATDGGSLQGPMTLSGSTLYGFAQNYGPLSGGATGDGDVYSISTGGSSFKVLHTFKADGTEGAGGGTAPTILSGKIYGARSDGGSLQTNGSQYNYGTLYSMSTSGSSFTRLFDFNTQGFHDGTNPYAAAIQGKDGNFYGTTYNGGFYNQGTVYKATPAGVVTILRNFYGGDGANPYGTLAQGPDGTLYGSTDNGGIYGNGTVFSIKTDGTFTQLASFGQSGGQQLVGGLVFGQDGNLYGTSYYGGRYNDGIVFRMSLTGDETIIHSFTRGADGAYLNAALVQGSDGTLYGTTVHGGVASVDQGTVFSLTTGGTFKTLHQFNDSSNNDGYYPDSGLVIATDGYLYGTTNQGGTNNYGTIFHVKTDGSSYKVLLSFDPNTEGGNPASALTQGSDGKLYGTTTNYGPGGLSTGNNGTAFSIKTDGSSLSILHAFTNDGTQGINPDSAILEANDGNFYGTTYNNGNIPYPGTSVAGTFYKLTTLLPLVTSFSPSSATVGSSIVLKGVNFTGASAVKFNGTSASSYTVDSDTQITAKLATTTTDGKVAVTTSKGTGTSSGTFKVLPSITSFSPSGGNAGTTVTIDGGGFTSGATVKFGSLAASSVTFVSSTQIKAVAPSGVKTGTISVTVPNGTATSSTSFQIVPAPTITSFSPTSGSVGTTVTIVGTNLDTVTAVKFNGTSASQFLATDSTHISAKVPSGATTGKISVVNPSATATSSGDVHRALVTQPPPHPGGGFFLLKLTL